MESRAARERLLPAPFLPFGRRAGFRPEKLGAAAAWTPACLHRNQAEDCFAPALACRNVRKTHSRARKTDALGPGNC